ncbi:MAG: hypothetical protein JWO12_3570 [Frankiales bacterium]|nr:hypothetical protein [Frankiales bacterium]
MANTTTRLLSGLAVAGLATLTLAPSAVAAPPGTGCKPVQGKPAYPPGQCKKPAISDSSPSRGEKVTVYSGEGEFTKDSSVTVELHSTVYSLGTVTADSTGGATVSFTIPSSISTGRHAVVFSGDALGLPNTVSVGLTVSGSSAGGGLPFTGFELGAASLLGAGLLGAGTLAVVSGRKRKDGLHTA